MTAVPIYQPGQDFSVPRFELKLAERDPGKDVVHDVLTVTYRDKIGQLDSFEITVNNWDAEKGAFKYSDQKLFDPGKKVELAMGYRGKDSLRRMITGEITSLRPSFPAGGAPTLAVSGLNLLHRLRTKQRSQAYKKLTDSKIAKQIAGRLKIELRPNPPPANERTTDYLFQDNRYDIIFLWERARRLGYDLFVNEDGPNGKSCLYFGPSVGVRAASYELVYGESLIQFQPNLTTANQVSKVRVVGWDSKHKAKIEGIATRVGLSTQGVGEKGGQKAIEKSFAEREEVVTHVAVKDKDEAEKLARETLENIAKDMIKGSGSTVGLPDLRAGSVLQIKGLGDRFSGRYFVTATTHTLGDSGYTTQFECRREELES